MSVEIMLALCRQRHISVHRVEKELKYGNGYFRSLKKKEIPSNRLKEVADYFGVSVDFMLGATPESYLLWTEYQLAEAEKAYSKATDLEKQEELAAKIEGFKESLEDQRMFPITKKAVPDGRDGGNDSHRKRVEINRLLDSAPEWLQNQIYELLRAEESDRTSPGVDPKGP